MDDVDAQWLRGAAEALALDPLTPDEITLLLDVAREVAHGTERRFAPLSCFLLGLAAAQDRSALGELGRRLGRLAAAD